MKKKIVNQGDFVEKDFCPNCHEKLIVKMKDGGTQVFECENCKFVKEDI
jgi:DNA-directed RNA polymerase subunit M/transcription elongation factor TFIIS